MWEPRNGGPWEWGTLGVTDWNRFYGSEDPTNSVMALKDMVNQPRQGPIPPCSAYQKVKEVKERKKERKFKKNIYSTMMTENTEALRRRRARPRVHYRNCSSSNHRLRGSASTVLTATGQVNGRWRILTPHRIETHGPIATKFRTIDYVREGTP